MDGFASMDSMLPPQKGTDGPLSERITYERSSNVPGGGTTTRLPFEELLPKKSGMCWGCCNYANASLDDTPRSIRNFFRFAYGTYASSDTTEYYENLFTYFRDEVCGAIEEENERYEEDSVHRAPVPEWSKTGMREHFEHHLVNPSIQNCKDIKRLKVLLDLNIKLMHPTYHQM